MRNTNSVVFREWSRGVIRTAQSSICPANSVRLALNLDSDQEAGSLVSRAGTGLVGTQAVASATCLGLHYFRDSVGSNHKLFGVFADGVNNDIYDLTTGTKSLEDDTLNRKTRFCTYLNSCARVNGFDAVKSWNGSAWVTSGGAFDEADAPRGSVIIEWKDRVYIAGVQATPDILYYSTVADPDARTISWTVTASDPDSAGQVEVEQEDGGGGITALEKVPGYLLIFKERSMKRWDGMTTNPEDMVNVGAPSQEAVCRGRGMVFVANQEGVWVTNGGYPSKISKPIQDLWDAIPAANLASIATYCDEVATYVHVGDITLDGNTYTNVAFKFNIDSQTWDIYSYYDEFSVFAWYLVSSERVVIGGNKNGQAIRMNVGTTDYASTEQPITYSFETQDIEFGSRLRIKELSKVASYTKNCRTGQLFLRTDSDLDSDWQIVGNVTGDVTELDTKALGHWFQFKLTGTATTGPVKILGLEFPSQSINITDNSE